mmetsp:Transcript_32876/g.69178  ORF Transcript_32876/g.69178 Transcript_32876/m.69178 type:complete len:214 (-) Transcript_32876:144-785(-)
MQPTLPSNVARPHVCSSTFWAVPLIRADPYGGPRSIDAITSIATRLGIHTVLFRMEWRMPLPSLLRAMPKLRRNLHPSTMIHGFCAFWTLGLLQFVWLKCVLLIISLVGKGSSFPTHPCGFHRQPLYGSILPTTHQVLTPIKSAKRLTTVGGRLAITLHFGFLMHSIQFSAYLQARVLMKTIMCISCWPSVIGSIVRTTHSSCPWKRWDWFGM